MNNSNVSDVLVIERATKSLRALRSSFENAGRTEEAQLLGNMRIVDPSTAESALGALSVIHAKGVVDEELLWAEATCLGVIMSEKDTIRPMRCAA